MEEKRILTVTQLNNYMKVLIDSQPMLKNVCVKGEISNLKFHSSGHLYFTIKEGKSQLSAIMFRSVAEKMPFRPENGISVLCYGRVAVYEDAGQYQLYVTKMESDGIGALYIAFEQLKRKLQSEGLFDTSRKRRLPKCPFKVGIVTSPTGAAVRDMINVGRRRFPAAQIYLYPSLVQGADAPKNIIQGIKFFNTKKRVDAIIIGRGGGSIEDLWAFNNEELARAISASSVPIVSAVGHETDFTISDFVADVRAATPSVAAELVFPDETKFRTQLDNVVAMMNKVVLGDIDKKRRRVSELSERRALTSPYASIDDKRLKLVNIEERLDIAVEKHLERYRYKLNVMSEKLPLLSPKAPLKRGYVLAQKDGKVIKSASDLSLGDKLTITLVDGTVKTTVDEKEVNTNE